MADKLIGKKVGMTRYFIEEGDSLPVTIVQAGPCVVIQKKTRARDGYEAIQVGFEEQKENRLNKPVRGHQKKAGEKFFSTLREIQVEDSGQFELGQEIGSDIFTIGEYVNVTGWTKGRGYTGVTKRWGFAGGKKTHGSRSHRVPGSIGMCATPGRVLKGKKLPGQKGNEKRTIKNLQVVDVRPEMNVVVLKGAVPGSRNSIVEIRKA